MKLLRFSDDGYRNLPGILFTANLFLLLAFYFTMAGMHDDGLIYSSIAANMSHHVGSFWDPHFSDALWPHFFEHPPLAFYLQSLFIQLVGDNPFIDKLYFFILSMTSLGLVLWFWRQRFPQISLYWLWFPILCWLANHQNMAMGYHGFIEATLMIFTTLATFCILKGLLSPPKQALRFHCLGALLVVCGFFTNGLQAFFPLVVPIIHAFVFNRGKKSTTIGGWLSWKVTGTTLGLLLFILGLIAVILLYPAARQNTIQYFQQQIIASISGARSDDPSLGLIAHAKIFKIFFSNFIEIFLFSTCWFWIYSKQNQQPLLQVIKAAWLNDWCRFFLLISLASSLPVCISPRQSSHYFAQSYPFWTLFFIQASMPLCVNVMTHWHNLPSTIASRQRLFVNGMIGILIILIGLNGYFAGRPSFRNRHLIHDAEHLKILLPPYSKISISNSREFMIHHVFLFYRYHYLCLTTEPNQTYYLQNKTEKNWPEGYEPVKTTFETFRLFKKSPINIG